MGVRGQPIVVEIKRQWLTPKANRLETPSIEALLAVENDEDLKNLTIDNEDHDANDQMTVVNLIPIPPGMIVTIGCRDQTDFTKMFFAVRDQVEMLALVSQMPLPTTNLFFSFCG